SLADIASERLFTVDVLLPLECRQRGECVRVFGGTDHDSIELAVLQLVVQAAEIPELPRLGGFLRCFLEVIVIHIAEGDDVLAEHLSHIFPTASAAADDGEVEFLVGSARAHKIGTAKRGDAGQGGTFEELTAIEAAGGGRTHGRLLCWRWWGEL